ncbi:MAG: hypothetical protein EXS18_02505 [Verrucomicrobiae bacterium]|nr:hypothetical protein [Verrucomicrobiae bacterium]
MNSKERIAALVLTALYLVPIWLYPVFPTQDGPSHLYNSVIFSDLLWSSEGFFHKVYEINWAPFPNWTFTLLSSLMYPLLPIEQVEKVVLSIYLVSFIGAIFYLVRSFDTEKTVIGFAGFLFAYNWFLWMGFYNFCLSLPLVLVTIGFAIRHRGFVYGQRLYLLMLMFLLLYFSHLVSFALTMGVLTLMFAGFGQKRGRALRQLLIAAAPALALFGIYYFAQPHSSATLYWAPGEYLAATFFSFKIGPWFNAWETVWLVAFWLVMGTWVFLTWRQFRDWGDEERSWWLVVAGTASLCIAMPNNLLGGTSLNERLAIFVGLFMLVTLSLKRWTFPKWWLGAALAVLVVAQLLYIHLVIRDWNRQLEPFQQLGRRIAHNSKVLPLIYADNVVGFFANPLLHADAIALAESHSVSPCNYEGFTGYFPVRYKSKSIIPVPDEWYKPDAFIECDLVKHYDYVIAWKATQSRLEAPAFSKFTQVYASGDLVLLKHR